MKYKAIKLQRTKEVGLISLASQHNSQPPASN